MERNALLVQSMEDPADERLRPSLDEAPDHDEIEHLTVDRDRMGDVRPGIVQLGKVDAVMDNPQLVVCGQTPFLFVMPFLELADTDNPLAAAVNQLPVPFRGIREGETVEGGHHLHLRKEQSQDADHRIRGRLRMDDVDMMVQDSLPQRPHVLEHVPGREIIVLPIEDAQIERRLGPLATDVVNERLRASVSETSQEKRDFHYLRWYKRQTRKGDTLASQIFRLADFVA